MTRCYKCHGFGHFARDCKGLDRTAMCYACGQEGHKGKECTQQVKCPLCTELGADNKHRSGRMGCKVYRNAIEMKKNLHRSSVVSMIRLSREKKLILCSLVNSIPMKTGGMVGLRTHLELRLYGW